MSVVGGAYAHRCRKAECLRPLAPKQFRNTGSVHALTETATCKLGNLMGTGKLVQDR
jgi:hypothetical protein